MDKSQIRQQIQSRRLAMSAQEVKEKSEEIVSQVLKTEAFAKASVICLYFPIHNEVDPRGILSACRLLNKRTAAPRIHGREMEFFFFSDEDELVPGRYGILEPAGDECVQEKALILMPGVAFDKACHRIGHGGGFYDRYLAEHPEHETMALAYDFQVLKKIPYESFDVLPQTVVTESRIMQPEKN